MDEFAEEGITTQVPAKVEKKGKGLKISIPPGVPRGAEDVVKFPDVVVSNQGARLEDEKPTITIVHDKKAYDKIMRQKRERADFARELECLLAERNQVYKHWSRFSPRELATIEEEMKPGPRLPVGMIRKDSRLVDVLERQRQEIQALGLTDVDFAMAISSIFEAYIRAGMEGKLEEDECGRFARKGYLKIYRLGSSGFQECPFGCKTLRNFSKDYMVVNQETKRALWLADIHDHFPKHGFYEEDTFSETDFSNLSYQEVMSQGIAAVIARMALAGQMKPFVERGVHFANRPYDIDIKKTAEFLEIRGGE